MLSLKEMALAIGADYRGADVPFKGFSIDSREIEPGTCFVAFKGARVDGHAFIPDAIAKGASAVLCQEPLSLSVPTLVVENTEKAVGQLAYQWRKQFSIPIIAITGSSGKTTVKHLTASILKERFCTLVSDRNFNSQYSLPLVLGMLGSQHEVAVLEMGARFPGDIRYLMEIAEPTIGLVTLVNPCHIAKFGTLETIAQTKGELFQYLPSTGVALLNHDDPFFEQWMTQVDSKAFYTFGMQNNSDYYPTEVQETSLGSQFVLVTPQGSISIRLPLPGRHNIANAVSAGALALQAGATLQDIQAALEKATPAYRRLERHTLASGTLIDDSYNASPVTMKIALQVLAKLEGTKIFFMGDMAELDEQTKKESHAAMGLEAKRLGIKHLYGVGPLTAEACRAFGDGAKWFDSQEALLKQLPQLLQESAVYLVKGSRGSRMDIIADAILLAQKLEVMKDIK